MINTTLDFKTALPLDQIEAVSSGRVFSAVETGPGIGEYNPYYVDYFNPEREAAVCAARIIAKLGEYSLSGQVPMDDYGVPDLAELGFTNSVRTEHQNARQRGVLLAYKAMLLDRSPFEGREGRWNYELSGNGIAHSERFDRDLAFATPTMLHIRSSSILLGLSGGRPLYRAKGLRHARNVRRAYLRFEDNRRGVE